MLLSTVYICQFGIKLFCVAKNSIEFNRQIYWIKKKRVYILFRQGQRKITITIIWRKKKCEKKTSEDFISLIVYYSTTAKESTNVFSSASVLKLSSTRYICIFCIVFSCKNRVKSVKAISVCVFLSCNQAVMNWLQSTLMIIPRSDCEL